jgi:signal transduction histidine kinase
MQIVRARRLPMHRALEELDAWLTRPSPSRVRRLVAALGYLISANGAEGAYLHIDAPPLPRLELGIGSLAGLPAEEAKRGCSEYGLMAADGQLPLGTAWLPGSEAQTTAAAHALELAFDAAWSRTEARAAGRRLAALDAAVRGIAGIQSVDRVLQLIVDRVRELSAAEYAALGIVGHDGYLERFLTSGISEEHRARIGILPRGRGLLGAIIREGAPIRVDDIGADPRRHGFPPHHPSMHSFLGVPIRSKDGPVGNLYLTNKQGADGFSAADQRLIEMFALHAGIAIENARLHERVAQLAVVSERERIGQDLHDGIIQSLYGVALSLEDVPDILVEDFEAGSGRIDRAIDSIHQTIRDIRNFILGLEPELLEQADLANGLRALAAEFQGHTVTDLEVLVDDPLTPLPAATRAHLLAITREGLSNIARHADATRAQVELRRDPDAAEPTLRLIIGDNGRGFDPRAPRSEEHHGLVNLRSRAQSLGGSFDLRSEANAGTRLEVVIPLGGQLAVQPNDEQEATNEPRQAMSEGPPLERGDQ